MYLSAEARGLVKVLLKQDPTARLTAEQTLLHPWVKAMASICRQRALTDKSQWNTTVPGAEPEGAQRPAQNAAETVTNKRPEHTSRGGEMTFKELSRTDDKQTETVSARGQDEDKPLLQQSKETKPGVTISPQIKVHTLPEATPGQENPECTSSDRCLPNRELRKRDILQTGPELSHTDPTSLSVELSQKDNI